jgi:methionyl-tRNA formyltransferase
MGKRKRRKLIGELVALYGLGGFLRLGMRNAVLRLLGKLKKGRGARTYHSIPQIAAAYGVPCQSVGDPNDSAYREALRARQVDLLVSVACPYILKQDVWRLAPLGGINIHHAPLPRFKGMMPTFWQLYHGEKTVGVTIHSIAAKVDEGEALLQEELAVEAGETLDRLIVRSKRHGAHCMAKVLRQIASGTQQPIRLNQSQSSYFTFPTAAESKEFRRRGYRAI